MKLLLLMSLLLPPTASHLCEDCTPENWSYPWLRVGDSWFTVLNTRRAWYDQMIECGLLEKGRSSIASIRSRHELEILEHRFQGRYWLGGFEVSKDDKSWYWWNRSKVDEVKTYYGPNEMNNYSGEHSVCMHFYKGEVTDARCDYELRAICEVRC